MKYEEAVTIWAAKKFGVPRHQIKEIQFRLQDIVTWTDTFGNEDHGQFVIIRVIFNNNRKDDYHNIDGDDFTSILEQLVMVASGEFK